MPNRVWKREANQSFEKSMFLAGWRLKFRFDGPDRSFHVEHRSSGWASLSQPWSDSAAIGDSGFAGSVRDESPRWSLGLMSTISLETFIEFPSVREASETRARAMWTCAKKFALFDEVERHAVTLSGGVRCSISFGFYCKFMSPCPVVRGISRGDQFTDWQHSIYLAFEVVARTGKEILVRPSRGPSGPNSLVG